MDNTEFYLEKFTEEEAYENEVIKFIWGIKANDDLSDSDANLYTLNDIDLIYLKDENKYVLSVETIYYFDEEKYKLKYLIKCLDAFTRFMNENGYDINKKPFWMDVFSFNIDSKFDSIEDCYAMFKMLVNGYCSL